MPYLGTLSRINTILMPRIWAHPPFLAQCKVHRPWALFHEGTVLLLILMFLCIGEYSVTNYLGYIYCNDSASKHHILEYTHRGDL